MPIFTYTQRLGKSPCAAKRALLAVGLAAAATAAAGQVPAAPGATGAPSVAAGAGGPAPLVFIHGIKGGRLVTPDGDVRWLTLLSALGLSTPDLALPARFDGGVQPRDALLPGGVLDGISVIPYLAKVDIYGSFLAAASGFGHPFHPYSYDWRRDLSETAAQFATFLEGVAAEHGGARPAVVAHSMGGLLTLAVLNRRPELFSRVVFAGVPFAGGVGFLPDLTEGSTTGLNSDLLPAAVMATFPAVFGLFPLGGTPLLAEGGTPLPVDFFEVDSWRRLKMGPFAAGEPPLGYVAFLTEALEREKRFRQELVKADVAYPRILVVAGRHHQTLTQAVQNGPHAVLGWDYQTAPQTDGDGLVSFAHAMPPDGIPYALVETGADHVHLLSDPDVQARIRTFLDE